MIEIIPSDLPLTFKHVKTQLILLIEHSLVDLTFIK